jgi:VWFA-related protein
MARCRPLPRRPGGRAAGLLLIACGAGLAVLASASSPPSAGQAAQSPGIKPLQHEVSVVLKLIQVYVTDKKGQPVADLGLGDFTVTDNGQTVVLTEFEKHTLTAPPETGAPGGTEGAPPGPAPASERSAKPEENRKFFLFFDFAYNNPRGLVKARTAALRFLDDKLGPEDEVAVLTYSMLKGVRIHEFLSRDRAKVREVVAGVGSKDIAGRAADLELQYWLMAQEPLAGMGAASSDFIAANANRPVFDPNKTARDEAKRIAQAFILRLTDLAKSLRYVPGQKHFLFFSTGVPASMIYGGQSGNPSSSRGSRTAFDPGDRVLRTQNEEMFREFGASGCTFYAFDTRESAKGANLFAYDALTFESGSRGLASTQGIYQDSTDIFQDEKTTGLNSLKRLTDITGGRYYANINMYEKNLEQVESLTGTYYVLGYPVPEREDGRFHEVKVAVARPGCEVRAQSGYYNPKPFAEMTRMEKDLHLYDLALNERSLSRLPAAFPVAALAFPSGEGLGLQVVATVPGTVAERFSGSKAEFVALVFDAKGNIRDVRRVEKDPERRRARPLYFLSAFALEPGDYTCRLVIRDLGSGLSAVGSVRTTVRAAPAASGLRLGTPLLLEAGSSGAYLEAGTPKGKAPLSWGEAYDFDRTYLAPVAGTVARLTPQLVVLVPYAVPGTAEPDVFLSVRFVNARSGAAATASATLVGRAAHGAVETLTLALPLDGLAPGTYHLYINAQDRVSGTMAGTRTTVTISKD